MIKVAFIGAGYMTTEHLKAFSNLPGVNIAGIYSRTKERAIKLKADYPTLLICNSISELYKKLTPDLVIIAVKYAWRLFNILGHASLKSQWDII